MRRPSSGSLPLALPLLALALLALALLVAGCAAATRTSPAADEGDRAAAPFADCAGLTTPVPHASGTPIAEPSPAGTSQTGQPAGTGQAGQPAGKPLPAVTLPCFTGGEPVDVGALRGPAVVNLWASWCAPCREELPVLQRLADRSAGAVRVVGVDIRDRRESAGSLGTDLGVSYPQLFDPDERLLRALGRPFVPVTLLIDGAGRIRHVDESGTLDDARLGGLVQRHLGVAVAT